MNKKTLVSTVVASYNMGKYLPEAIESILAQTYKNFEIIVVDDGSTDDTKSVIERYKDNDKVRYIYQENKGQPGAKNRGVLEARGDYIAFLDADDMWAPDKLEKQMPCFEISDEIGVVHTNFVLMDPDGKLLFTPERTYYNGYISEKLLIDNFVNGMSSVIKKQCFDDVGIFDENIPMGIDYDLWLRISAKYQFYFLDEKSYYYRQWEGQMSHNHKKRYECAVEIMRKFIENHPEAVTKKGIRNAWAHTYLGRGNTLYVNEKNRIGGLKFYLKSLFNRPFYLPTWKAIIKLFLNIRRY